MTNAWEKRKESLVNMGHSVYGKRSHRSFLIGLALVLGAAVTPAFGQGTGEFLCSAGTRDGQPCEAFSDCPNGVCVIAQGVCNNGAFCDCPGGTCGNTPVCSLNANFGTCVGGIGASSELCCSVSSNCATGQSCTGTSKVCLNGSDKGLPCVDSSQCASGTCGSTGFYCDGGDFDFYPCVDNGDCPGGSCDTSFVNVPTNTPNPNQTATPTLPPVNTSTPSGPTATVPPRNTSTPGTPAPTLPGATATRTTGSVNTPTPAPPTATFTPEIGIGVTTIGAANAGANKLEVDIDPAGNFPVEGVVDINGAQVPFTRRRSSRVLDIKAEFGLPFAVPAGSAVRVVEYTPTPGRYGEEDRDVEEGDGCAIGGENTSDGAWVLLLGATLMVAARRRRNA